MALRNSIKVFLWRKLPRPAGLGRPHRPTISQPLQRHKRPRLCAILDLNVVLQVFWPQAYCVKHGKWLRNMLRSFGQSTLKNVSTCQSAELHHVASKGLCTIKASELFWRWTWIVATKYYTANCMEKTRPQKTAEYSQCRRTAEYWKHWILFSALTSPALGVSSSSSIADRMAKHPAIAQQGTHVLIKSSFAHSVFHPKRMCFFFALKEWIFFLPWNTDNAKANCQFSTWFSMPNLKLLACPPCHVGQSLHRLFLRFQGWDTR